MENVVDRKRETRHGRCALIAIVSIIVLAVTTNVWIVASVVCGISAVAFTGHLLHIRRHWHRVPGRIVRYRITRGDNGKSFHPVYRFTMIDGRTIIGTTSWGYWRRVWSPGEPVRVFYCPTDPRRTELQSFVTWIAPFTSLALSIISAIVFWFDGPLPFR